MPAGLPAGVHEGPVQRALDSAQRPSSPALRPQSVALADNVITYSFGAALLGMLEAYWDSLAPGAFQVGRAVQLKAFCVC